MMSASNASVTLYLNKSKSRVEIMDWSAKRMITDGRHMQTKINMPRINLIIFKLLILNLCFTWFAHAADPDFQHAPTSFQYENRNFVPVDIRQQNVFWSVTEDLSFVEARSETIFSIQETGSPFLLLNPNATGDLVSKNGKEPFKVKEMAASPFTKSNFYYIDKVLKPGTYVVQFQYSLFLIPRCLLSCQSTTTTMHLLKLAFQVITPTITSNLPLILR